MDREGVHPRAVEAPCADEGPQPRSLPDDADIAGQMWPVWRAFLDSDLTLKQLAQRSGVKARDIEDMFLNPRWTKLRPWAALAYAMGFWLKPHLVPEEDFSDWQFSRLAARAGPRVAAPTPQQPRDDQSTSPTPLASEIQDGGEG